MVRHNITSLPVICLGRRSGQVFSLLTYTNDLLSQPPAPGQKRVKEDWENIWYIGMFGTIGVATVLLYYKPDTRCVSVCLSFKVYQCRGHSIQGWALKEAKARMEARGEKVQYEP